MIKLELPQLDIRGLPENKKAEAVNNRLDRIVTNLDIMLRSIEDGVGGGDIDLSKYLTRADVSEKANNSEVVHKAGAETITGSKTFSQTIKGTAKLTQGILFGAVDAGSPPKAMTATVEGVTELKNGVCCLIRNAVVTSASPWTLNVNGLGAKEVYSNMTTGNPITPTNPTRDTTIFNINYTMLFIYDEDLVEGGAWICFRGYDSNTNTIGYQIRTNSKNLPVSSALGRYVLLFTSKDGTHYVPANSNTSTKATVARDVTQTKIDPFGEIVYYGATTILSQAEAMPSATVLWQQYAIVLGYSFNRQGSALNLTPWKAVYLKCAPQSDGSAIIDATTPYTQTLPSNDDGKIYIFLGVAYSATNIELMYDHPIYYYKDGCIRQWTNCSADEITAMTSAEILNICQ